MKFSVCHSAPPVRRPPHQHRGQRCAIPHSYPPLPRRCISYAKVPNQDGPYAYWSLDTAVDAGVQKEKIAR